jgi:hypothetical protein
VRKRAAVFSLGPCLLVGIPPYRLGDAGAAAASSGPAPLRTAIGAGLYAGDRTSTSEKAPYRWLGDYGQKGESRGCSAPALFLGFSL